MLIISSDHFHWDKQNRCFTAEISELSHTAFGHHNLDLESGQYGFRMQSARTGKILWFRRGQIFRDQDNDIRYWHFDAYNPDNKEWLNLYVYND